MAVLRSLMADQSQRQVTPIDILPDDLLLAIFDFYVNEDQFTKKGIEAWQSLVHVCQRWRSVVFGSPRHLNLRLLFTPGRPMGMLDVWPALRLVVRSYVPTTDSDMDNIIAVLAERSDRVCRIDLNYDSRSQAEKVWAAMQEPFPELEHLSMFYFTGNREQVVPEIETFLGGSAPRLRFLQLNPVPFPGLPKLLLSAVHLVTLRLSDIPHSGYFSPEAIVTSLFQATSLNTLSLRFRSPWPCPDWERRRKLPLTRAVLPALTYFDFHEGASEYLEDLVARIDAPRLSHFRITLFDKISMRLYTTQLLEFINRTPTLKAHDEAHVIIDDGAITTILISRTTGHESDPRLLNIKIIFGIQPALLPEVSTSLPSLSMVESLYIYQIMPLDWEDEIRIRNTAWLELLHPYSAMKNLYLSKEFVPGIAAALQELVRDRIAEVLPSLQNIFVEGLELSGPFQEGIGRFVAGRQISGYPCAASIWNGMGTRRL